MDLEERIERLEHREAIRELRAEYCYAVDEGLLHGNWDRWLAVFTEDVRFDYGPVGDKGEGKEDLREFAKQTIEPSYQFFMHMVHNGILDIEDDHATGRWYFELPAVSQPGALGSKGKSGWIHGRYNEEYELTQTGWKISVVNCTFYVVGTIFEGWADENQEWSKLKTTN